MQTLERISIAEGTRAYAKLRSKVRAAGILDRSYSFYFVLIALTFAGYFLSTGAIFKLESYPLLGLACLGFAFFSVQLGGLMHDSGHRAVFKSGRANDILGVLCGCSLAMVFDNWRSRHNDHHAFPNEPGRDPDVEIPFISVSRALHAEKPAFQRFFIHYQAYYYYPLGAIVSFSNRLGSLSYFIRRRSRRDWPRLVAYLPAIAFLFVLPFAIFPLAKALFVFSLVHVLSGIYLANCFAPNHKGMDLIEDGDSMSFIEQQIVASRNVKGGVLTDIVLVGLNRQVEHHLFPSTPRNKLHLIRPFLEETCRDLGLKCVESGIIETNRAILHELRLAVRGV